MIRKPHLGRRVRHSGIRSFWTGGIKRRKIIMSTAVSTSNLPSTSHNAIEPGLTAPQSGQNMNPWSRKSPHNNDAYEHAQSPNHSIHEKADGVQGNALGLSTPPSPSAPHQQAVRPSVG